MYNHGYCAAEDGAGPKFSTMTHVGHLLQWLFQYQDSSALQAFGFDNSASRDELLEELAL